MRCCRQWLNSLQIVGISGRLSATRAEGQQTTDNRSARKVRVCQKGPMHVSSKSWLTMLAHAGFAAVFARVFLGGALLALVDTTLHEGSHGPATDTVGAARSVDPWCFDPDLVDRWFSALNRAIGGSLVAGANALATLAERLQTPRPGASDSAGVNGQDVSADVAASLLGYVRLSQGGGWRRRHEPSDRAIGFCLGYLYAAAIDCGHAEGEFVAAGLRHLFGRNVGMYHRRVQGSPTRFAAAAKQGSAAFAKRREVLRPAGSAPDRRWRR